VYHHHHLCAPKSSPPPRYARFMLSTKVHPALLSPGTNRRGHTRPAGSHPSLGRPHRTSDATLTSGQPGRRLASRVQVFDQINAAMLFPRHGRDASCCCFDNKSIYSVPSVTPFGRAAMSTAARHTPHADSPRNRDCFTCDIPLQPVGCISCMVRQ